MKYLLIIFVLALAIAPLTHILPSKRQRKVAKLREYAAVHGLFVEFRDLPATDSQRDSRTRAEQIIYYGRRLAPSRRAPRQRRAWLRTEEGWRGLQMRWEAPAAAATMPEGVMALGVDEGSCGVYWKEAGEEGDVQSIVDALLAWEGQLSGPA